MGITQKFEPVIGLEVHVELNTKTKMFCGCSADYFGKEPNTHTCPVCLGLPGALPFVNQEAIKKCIQIGLALNCSINEKSYFERKNYFYPDLAKGFQLSQLKLPVSVKGEIEVEDAAGGITKIRINRAHQEEDTAKLVHQDGGTYIDFNRSGVPLVEIVTEPDFKDTTQIKDYAKKLQQIFRYLGVSNADMERGDMRLEANVSVRSLASHLEGGIVKLPNYRVELKNINSFRFMAQAVEYEIKRQIEALENGEKLVQETRGWDEDKKQTYVQRSKEEAHDYRYFPEPDLPTLRTKNEELEIMENMVELPSPKARRFIEDYQIPKPTALLLVENIKLADFFEKTVKAGEKEGIAPSKIANKLINEKIDITSFRPEDVLSSISESRQGMISDDSALEEMAKQVMLDNPRLVADYKSGKLPVIQALIGMVMRKSAGKADASKVKILFERLLTD